MHSAEVTSTRIVLCACPQHCAQVLSAAGRARLRLQHLQVVTDWPEIFSSHPDNIPAPQPAQLHVLWALLPATATPGARAREAAWRDHWQRLACDPAVAMTVHMLYGNAAQQAQQLMPWIHRSHGAPTTLALEDCFECLDSASEQKLFQRLISP
jgi:hypothetical protein